MATSQGRILNPPMLTASWLDAASPVPLSWGGCSLNFHVGLLLLSSYLNPVWNNKH